MIPATAKLTAVRSPYRVYRPLRTSTTRNRFQTVQHRLLPPSHSLSIRFLKHHQWTALNDSTRHHHDRSPALCPTPFLSPITSKQDRALTTAP